MKKDNFLRNAPPVMGDKKTGATPGRLQVPEMANPASHEDTLDLAFDPTQVGGGDNSRIIYRRGVPTLNMGAVANRASISTLTGVNTTQYTGIGAPTGGEESKFMDQNLMNDFFLKSKEGAIGV